MIAGWLYEHSGGVVSIVISLLYDAQEIAILNGKEVLNIETLNENIVILKLSHMSKWLSFLFDYDKIFTLKKVFLLVS